MKNTLHLTKMLLFNEDTFLVNCMIKHFNDITYTFSRQIDPEIHVVDHADVSYTIFFFTWKKH